MLDSIYLQIKTISFIIYLLFKLTTMDLDLQAYINDIKFDPEDE